MTDTRPVLSGAGLSLRRWAYERLNKHRRTRWIIRDHFRPFRIAVDGLTFDLTPVDNATEQEMFLTGHLPEAASMELLLDRVRGRRALIFDIGANCGAYTVPLAKAAAPGSRIVAFEPNPPMADRLERNLALNGLTGAVEVERVALGDQAGTLTLNLHDRNLGQSSVHPLAGSRQIEVPIQPLAGFVKSTADYQAFVVKIDVEGLEDKVLVPFLDSIPVADLPDLILVEVILDNFWTLDLLAALERRGYRSSAELDGNVAYEKQAS